MEQVQEDQYIQDILKKIQALDTIAFDRFISEHSKKFSRNENWLFPMMYDYYANMHNNQEIISMLNQLGLFLHSQCQKKVLYEITSIDKSLCIDDSYVEEYVVEVERAQNKKPTSKLINSPWRTIGISMITHEIPSLLANSIILKYKDCEHPYILSDIAGMFIYGQRFIESLGYLYRSIKELVDFPNRYWNSDYGIAGAANTFRLLFLMCPSANIELSKKLFKYLYVYLTKLAYTTDDEVFQQTAYVNRADILFSISSRICIPWYINPELLYISDMYYAHYCNDLSEHLSYYSRCKFNIKSLTFYRNASFWPNDSGGYVDREEEKFDEIVLRKHEQAKFLAYDFFVGFQSHSDYISHKDIEELFKSIQHECRYNYKRISKKVLNFKSNK